MKAQVVESMLVDCVLYELKLAQSLGCRRAEKLLMLRDEEYVFRP